jgi:uncharacterized peroxidase-related enzyme
MAFIETVAPGEASSDVRAMYERVQAGNGYVPEHTKVFSLRPQVHAGWLALNTAIRGNMDLRRYELVTFAAARAMSSSYCMLAHGSILKDRVLDEEELGRILSGSATALTPAEEALMRYAEKIALDAVSVTAADIDELRGHGLNDGEIVDVAAAASARCFFSKFLDALGAEPDAKYAELDDDLRRLLTPGRSISRSPVERVPEAAPAVGP